MCHFVIWISPDLSAIVTSAFPCSPIMRIWIHIHHPLFSELSLDLLWIICVNLSITYVKSMKSVNTRNYHSEVVVRKYWTWCFLWLFLSSWPTWQGPRRNFGMYSSRTVVVSTRRTSSDWSKRERQLSRQEKEETLKNDRNLTTPSSSTPRTSGSHVHSLPRCFSRYQTGGTGVSLN